MGDNRGWIWGAALIALAVSYGEMARDTQASPCVYAHNWMTDLVNGNNEKRTCSAMLKESNFRIESQQAHINTLTDQIDELNIQPNTRFAADSPPTYGQPSGQNAPTLTADVGSEVAHSNDDQDD